MQRPRWSAIALLVLAGGSTARPAAPEPQETVDYSKDVKPLLRDHCYACHGALKQKARLRLDTAAAALTGGAGGPAVVPGNAAGSLLVQRVTESDPESRMPAEGPPLTGRQVALLRAWIDRGAAAPPDEKPEEPPAAHWAFRRPARPAVSGIDALVDAERKKRGLRPARPAPKEMLLRRVSIDLVGLPPTREALHAFLADRSDDAYEKVVERLLASPYYGERWGRHWMDVWRYSDWYGRREIGDVRNSYGQIWRWRDWIVKSLNEDKGYDRMILEMLAADEVAPDDLDSVVATGYLVRNWYSLNRNQWMRDLVEHTGKAFLGLTMNCAHCHDHKYDPIPQEDYFRFRAFFEPLQLRHERVPGDPDPGPFREYVLQGTTAVMKSGAIRIFDQNLEAETRLYLGGDERNVAEGRPPVRPAAPAFLGGDQIRVEPVHLPPDSSYPGLRPFVRAEEIARREQALGEAWALLEAGPRRLAEARLAAAESDLAAIRARVAADDARAGSSAEDPTTLARWAAAAERSAALAAARARLLEAQDAFRAAEGCLPREEALLSLRTAEGDAAAANKALESPGADYTALSPKYPARSTGRRTALARWIAAPENPLTARVAANHLWMRHFGRPLVESVFDFGRSGRPPSHPELLDWLAVELVDSGWSLKHLHRRIVTSETYRMSSDAPPAPGDPENRYLWKFPSRRMEAEAVRDSLFHAAGELDLRMGGPEIESTRELIPRRSLYFSQHAEAGGHMKFLEPFDAPDPCDAYRRSDSVLPQQALALTNSPLVAHLSRRLAEKLPSGDEEFIIEAFERTLTRAPSEHEREVCRTFLELQRALYASGDEARVRESLVRVLFNHADFEVIR